MSRASASCLALFASFCVAVARADDILVDKLLPQGKMYVGVDYYPEHWPEQRWKIDFRLMQEAGFNVVRLGEFAWANMEPTEGAFDFEWLERAVNFAHKHDIQVILGTPTAVMPAWLAHRYPGALSMKADGTRTVWGGRRHNCFSDEHYKQLAERVVQELVKRFSDHPAVVGWQIDNELGGADCRCEKCRNEFQKWLAAKYVDLATLNEAWGNRFWGLLITSWDQIPIPADREGDWAISNPSASLDWKRFGSWQNVEFLNAHAAIIRRLCPDSHFVTHNLMGQYDQVDYYELASQLDFVSWDNYPMLSPRIPYDAGLSADIMRGVKKRNFLIMEQTAGPIGWGKFSRNPRPGELRRICYQQLAHGADGQIWFRWRTCTAGREQYWHGLLGHDGRPGRRYREASEVAREYQLLAPSLAGTTVESDVAIIYDYQSLWALQIQNGYSGASHLQAIRRYYQALSRAGVGIDIVRPGDDLSDYKLVLAPHLNILPDDFARQLAAYVRSGGVLLADCRTGVKNEHNLVHARTLPGLLREPLGIEIEEYESTSLGFADAETTTFSVHFPAGHAQDATANEQSMTFHADKYVDWIKPTTARSVASYGDWHLESYAAVTRNPHGEGVGWYCGAVVAEDAFYDHLVKLLLSDADIQPEVRPPHGVEATVRGNPNHRYLCLINHTDKSQHVEIPAGGRDLLTGTEIEGRIVLPRFGVAVIGL